MNDVIIHKINGGLGRREPSKDMVSGLIGTGVAVPGGVQIGVVYRFKSVADAESLGITEDYDFNNGIYVYEHIKEFFRINPNGDLYFMLVNYTSYNSIITNPDSTKRLLKEAGGDIRQLGIFYNQPDKSPYLLDFSLVENAIPFAQQLADEEYNEHRPLQILLEGKAFPDPNDNAQIVTDLRSLNAKNVSVVIGQEYNKMSNLTQTVNVANLTNYAAVGTVLGAVSKARVNENIGWVSKFNLFGSGLKGPSLGQVRFEEVTRGNLETINDKGYIFFIKHIGIDGVYINDSHTCTAFTSDYAYIENNRTIDKAVREIRTVLLPRLNSPIEVDAETGQLSPEVIKSFESDGKRALEQMLSNGEISDFEIYIDPNQDILGTSELRIQFSIIPTGTARKITVEIGFKNPFNQ